MRAATGGDPKQVLAGLIAMFLCLESDVERFKFFGITGYRDSKKKVVNHSAFKHYIDEIDWPPYKVDMRQVVSWNEHECHDFGVQNRYLEMMLSEGLLNKQIAYELTVSEATVKAHVSAILQKLNVDSRTQAVITASRIGATSRAPSAA
jgi:DNA-binding CsgD family transcriptional regulator